MSGIQHGQCVERGVIMGEMTREELIEENRLLRNRLESSTSARCFVKDENRDYKAKIDNLEAHIKCLQQELSEI